MSAVLRLLLNNYAAVTLFHFFSSICRYNQHAGAIRHAWQYLPSSQQAPKPHQKLSIDATLCL
jgi:hypothetical protein